VRQERAWCRYAHGYKRHCDGDGHARYLDGDRHWHASHQHADKHRDGHPHRDSEQQPHAHGDEH
jgi:hypothetical protein